MIKKFLVLLLIGSSYTYADSTSDKTSNKSNSNDVLSLLNSSNSNTANKSSGDFVYVYQHDTLRSALTQYAKNNALQINFASDLNPSTLNQIVTGRFNVKNEIDVLNTLSSKYGFRWFIYSGSLYVTSSVEVTRSINVSTDEINTIRSSLDQMGLLNSKFGYSQGGGKVVVSGPSTYVDMLINQIKSLDVSPVNQQFAVFRLKYANANDVTLTINNETVTVPGVVTILQNLLQGKTNKSGAANANPLLSKIAQPLMNSGSSNTSGNSDKKSGALAATDADDSTPGSLSSPSIQADPHLNTVIVRDKKSNLGIYKNLIEVLDVPSPMIQVDVLVVRLNNTKLNEEGINWWASNGTLGIGYGANNLSTTSPGAGLSTVYGQVASGQLLLNSTNTFLSSLDYLQQQEIAEAVSRPAIVTTDNIPAVVSVTDSFYVNANGSTASSSSSSSTTSSSFNQAQVVTSLQVTPHVIFNANGKKEIKLSIALQDGNVDTLLTNQMPETVQSSLNSQAVITEGQSLLLAGYTKDKKVNIEKKVPFLGDIPILGWFFKSSSSEQEKFTTLYLVSPKIVWLSDAYKLKGYVMVNDKQLKTNPYDETLSKNKTAGQ